MASRGGRRKREAQGAAGQIEAQNRVSGALQNALQRSGGEAELLRREHRQLERERREIELERDGLRLETRGLRLEVDGLRKRLAAAMRENQRLREAAGEAGPMIE